MKQKKAFIKPFEAPQRSMKIKIQVDFLSLPGIGTGRVNTPSTTSGYLVFLSVSFNMKKYVIWGWGCYILKKEQNYNDGYKIWW